MLKIAKDYLNNPRVYPLYLDPVIKALREFVYNGGIWDKNAREKYAVVSKRKPKNWTLEDVYAYLTFIFVTDRTNEGCIEKHVKNGVIEQLLTRYLELAGEAQ